MTRASSTSPWKQTATLHPIQQVAPALPQDWAEMAQNLRRATNEGVSRGRPAAKMMVNGRMPSGKTVFTPRIALLDTGAGFNLISSQAFRELNLAPKPSQQVVRSIGGDTRLVGKVELTWRFRASDVPSKLSQTLYSAVFYILPEQDEAKFDCILGWPWIEENLDLCFYMLRSMR